VITSADIYWITRLDSIVGLLVAVIIALAITSVVHAFIGAIRCEEMCRADQKEGWRKYRKINIALGIALLITSTIVTFVPSTKTAVAIYMVPKIVNNEQVQKLPDNAMSLINGKFEEWINDMANKKNK
jgi:large-conductance mechanosensitive channel